MRNSVPFACPSILFLSFLLLSQRTSLVRADPAVVPFQDCFDEPDNVQNKLQVSTVYAQVLEDADEVHYLNLTVIGTSPSEIVGVTNTSNSLATLFTSTSVLTLDAWNNASYFCHTLRPPSPLPAMAEGSTSYCPLPAGPFAFSATIPWGNNRELTSLNTRLRAVDPFGQELLCLDVTTTPLEPTPHSIYGRANIILWSTVGLTLAYWVVVGIARVSTAWNRGISRPGKGVWSRAQSAGFIIASAISGERLAASPALLRFCTPSMRDVIFHTQWCALLGMVAVQWPQFIYPLLTQASWSTLTYNVTLVPSAAQYRWHPLSVPSFSPPAEFEEQMADSLSPLFIDRSIHNTLFTLPLNATHGMSSFAYTLGVRPQDLFPTCLILFLGIIGGTVIASALLWFLDVVVTNLVQKFRGRDAGYAPGTINRLGTKSPAFGTAAESSTSPTVDEHKPLTNGFGTLSKSPSGNLGGGDRERGIGGHRWFPWLRFRSDIGSFHGNVLHGNLVRILVWFHLPVTVFSCYQMTMSKSIVSSGSIALAALSFVVFSILIPAHLVIRVTFTTTNKLYDETRTLLSLGPLYNHYRHGSQLFASLFFATNIAFGVTIGAGQKSGTAQAIVILVVEVISALVTSIWLPWGSGASMGLISFLFCVARIVIAVLLVILTPTISIGSGPGGWVAYGILMILALVYLALLIMLAVKLIEGAIRIFGGVGFDRSKSAMDAGILGACGLLGCGSKRRKDRGRNHGKHSSSGNSYKPPGHESSPSLIGPNGKPYARRNSDLSSYNPPAFLSNDPERASLNGPRFAGGSDSRKGSIHSQPPSFLRPEHANQPYREETDQDWWIENENRGGGAFIMGAWQPASGEMPMPSHPAHAPSTPSTLHQYGPQHPQRQANASASTSAPTPTGTSSSGFSRVGGGRSHIDAPFSIVHNANSSQPLPAPYNPSSSTQAFPSIGQAGSNMLAPPPSTSSPLAGQQPHRPAQTLTPQNHPPSSFYRHQHPSNSGAVFVADDDEPPLPLSTVRQAQTAAVASHVQPQQYEAEYGNLPPGAMQPAHVRTKSQTAIVEDAGYLYQGPNAIGGPNSASQSGLSARLQNPLRPLKLSGHRNASSGSTGSSPAHPPPSAPARFTLNAEGDDDDDDADSTAEDQQQKKKWYHLRKKRPHSSEGRTTTTTASNSASNISSNPLPLDSEFGGGVEGTATPQRSFVVVRKPAGSMGRLNQPANLPVAQQGSPTPRSKNSRPPTR
ncbi:membrane protein [Coprinopsis sp. MPI-PUGE-AT-0042]|nr:membrane protein [Coprinopsis sp. MPI-PUGE-AT-0042]